jgi:hypothetical protein
VLIETDDKGNPVITADVSRIAGQIRQHGFLLTVIDPLIKAHHGIENRNEHMDAIGVAANGIASENSTSVLLAAHFRKGGGEDGSRDAFRGGSALIDGMRVARTLIHMSEADGRAFNLPPTTIASIVREQNPKANMAPRQPATWFELVSIPLGNTEVSPIYKAGDHVQAIKPWLPPTTFEGCTTDVLTRIFKRLRGEPEQGWFYSPEPRSKYWAGTVIVDEAGKSREQAADMLRVWVSNGVLIAGSYTNPNRRTGSRVILNEARIAEILVPTRAFEE